MSPDIDSEHPLITLRRSAMDYLARREHSFYELQQKLGKKYPEHDADELIFPAIQRLKEENLQSDQRFAESYVRHRCNNGFGPLKIDYELNQKGLAASLIKAELYSDDNDWSELCRQALEKKFARQDLSLEADSGQRLKDMQRKQRFLLQRGFAADIIRSLVKLEL